MIIYNVTVKVTNEIETEWVEWMKTVHIPDVMNTGLFLEHKFCRVMSFKEKDGATYAIQYFCESTAVLHQYQARFAPKLQKEFVDKYKESALTFRTLMEVL